MNYTTEQQAKLVRRISTASPREARTALRILAMGKTRNIERALELSSCTRLTRVWR